MENKELLTADRLIYNLNHFDDKKPSKWTEGDVFQAKVLMRLISKFLSGEKIYVKKLDDRTNYERAKEVFE